MGHSFAWWQVGDSVGTSGLASHQFTASGLVIAVIGAQSAQRTLTVIR